MSKFLRGFSLVLAAAALVAAPLAQASTTTPLLSHENYTVGQGDIGITFGSQPALVRGDVEQDLWTLDLGANYFVTDIFAPGAMMNLKAGGGTTVRFIADLKAYWPGLGRVLPYAMIGLGMAHFPGVNLFDFAIGPGIDYMLSNSVALGFAFQYDLGIGSSTVHVIQFPLAFNVYFKF
ncbi:MAG: hypothetical protein V1798_04155 [Pseudomonadota bacterium]